MYKKDFPVFENNPNLVFLDSAASSQKPRIVIDWVSDFVAKSYANIHRWLYDLSEKSETLYYDSKLEVAKLLNCKPSEIFYTYNSTYAINVLAWALIKSKFLEKWDVILLSIGEHHANVLPWQILSEEYWLEVRFFYIKDDFDIDREDFDKQYTKDVKVVACSHVSNVTGQIYDMKKLKSKLRDSTFFLVDWSQSVPHFAVDVQDISCDALVFTGHKMMAYTGIGVAYLQKKRIKELSPMIAGWGTISDVSVSGYSFASGTDKFEAGTPNIVGAVSLLKAIEYINSIGGMEKFWEHEKSITEYALKSFQKLSDKIDLIGSFSVEDRVWAFSFVCKNEGNFNKIWEIFAKNNVAVRCGGHCAYPLHKKLGIWGTCRMSTYIYNDQCDIDRFFEVLSGI